jgi:hypothetical protein
MGNTRYLSSERRAGLATAGRMGRTPSPGAPEELVAAAVDALNDMGSLVSSQCFSRPESLTQDKIMAYALALVRLRECAGTAGFERLMNACDALAVTVSRLIEDKSCACSGKCAALTQFIVHAQAMIQMSIDSAQRHISLPLDFRTLSGRTNVEPSACPPL